MGNWSVEPNTGLVSINNNGLLTFQEHNTDTEYTIKYSDNDCSATKKITIRACSSCDCSSLTVTGKTDISSNGGSNIIIGSFSKTSCMSNARASSTDSWLSNIAISGSEVKATVAASTSDSRNGSVTITVDKSGGGTCQKTMAITQKKEQAPCPYPDDTIGVYLYRSTIPHHICSYFVLLDAPITDDAKEWIKESGYKYYPPSDIFEDMKIGEYKYEDCEVSNFITDSKYCSIKTGAYSNKKLDVGGKYYWYLFVSQPEQWVMNQIFVLPTSQYCQEHVESYCHCCWVLYEINP